MPSQKPASTPICNAPVHGAAGAGGDVDVEVIHVSKTSNSVKALVGIAYGGRVGWATVSTGGGMNDKITYRTLDIGMETMKRFRSMEKNGCQQL